ncbi:hypothetical protein ABES02_29265 [Neobacillus pocheonensis]|uniref:hypothetical protein n=1 Tax=Neobacillus pocheonensis TaxID=363869 RepID=UPI003D26700C
MDARRRLDVNQPVKNKFTEVKRTLKSNTEVETAAYLLAMFEQFYSGLTIKQNEQLIKRAQEIMRQQTLNL